MTNPKGKITRAIKPLQGEREVIARKPFTCTSLSLKGTISSLHEGHCPEAHELLKRSRKCLLLLPLQGVRLHWKYLIESPAQVRPPFRGAGLEHVRLLLMVPAVPQLLEQEDKVPQEPQLPFTAAIENSEFQNKTGKKEHQDIKSP